MLHFFCAALCKGEWMHCILMHYFCAAFCLCCIISYFRMLHNLLMHLHAFTCIVLRCINNAFMFCCIHLHSYAFLNSCIYYLLHNAVLFTCRIFNTSTSHVAFKFACIASHSLCIHSHSSVMHRHDFIMQHNTNIYECMHKNAR